MATKKRSRLAKPKKCGVGCKAKKYAKKLNRTIKKVNVKATTSKGSGSGEYVKGKTLPKKVRINVNDQYFGTFTNKNGVVDINIREKKRSWF